MKNWTDERQINQSKLIVQNDLRQMKSCVFKRFNKAVWWSPRNVVANVLDCLIVVSEFELHSRYYVNFWINTFGKGMNSFPSAMG